jgi:hypothetical protein
MLKQDNKLLKDMAHPYYLVPESAGKPLDQLPDKGVAPYPVKSAAAKGWYAKLYCPICVCMCMCMCMCVCLAHSCAVEHAAAELALPSRVPWLHVRCCPLVSALHKETCIGQLACLDVSQHRGSGCRFGPFVMAPCNELVVRRSNALLGYGAPLAPLDLSLVQPADTRRGAWACAAARP